MTPAAQMSTSMPWQALFTCAPPPPSSCTAFATHHDTCCPDVHLHAMAAAKVLGRHVQRRACHVWLLDALLPHLLAAAKVNRHHLQCTTRLRGVQQVCNAGVQRCRNKVSFKPQQL
jgi:hypothetical protein